MTKQKTYLLSILHELKEILSIPIKSRHFIGINIIDITKADEEAKKG